MDKEKLEKKLKEIQLEMNRTNVLIQNYYARLNQLKGQEQLINQLLEKE